MFYKNPFDSDSLESELSQRWLLRIDRNIARVNVNLNVHDVCSLGSVRVKWLHPYKRRRGLKIQQRTRRSSPRTGVWGTRTTARLLRGLLQFFHQVAVRRPLLRSVVPLRHVAFPVLSQVLLQFLVTQQSLRHKHELLQKNSHLLCITMRAQLQYLQHRLFITERVLGTNLHLQSTPTKLHIRSWQNDN